MELRQFYLDGLGHASYLVGSDDSREALVVDPRRDVDVYVDAATERGLRIRYVLDTHQHNDYLSGIRELVDRTGATAPGSAEADLGYNHEPLKDGQDLELAEARLTVLHTPGHTPEHIALVVYDGEQSADEPALLLSGGALLVGDLARPDLLGGEEQARRWAEAFCHTIQTKLFRPARPHARVPDPRLRVAVRRVDRLAPRHHGGLRATNQPDPGVHRPHGGVRGAVPEPGRPPRRPAVLEAHAPAEPARTCAARHGGSAASAAAVRFILPRCPQRTGTLVLDTRAPEAFAGGHVPDAVNVGWGSSFATWAGTALPADAEILLVADDAANLMGSTWQLLRIGYDRPAGWLAGGMHAWRQRALPLRRLPTAAVHELEGHLDEYHILDVRQPAEWSAFRAPVAQFITGAELPNRLDEVPRDRDVLVTCGSGYRSSFAASLLRRHGHLRVTNLLGGMTAWKQAGLPLA